MPRGRLFDRTIRVRLDRSRPPQRARIGNGPRHRPYYRGRGPRLRRGAARFYLEQSLLTSSPSPQLNRPDPDPRTRMTLLDQPRAAATAPLPGSPPTASQRPSPPDWFNGAVPPSVTPTPPPRPRPRPRRRGANRTGAPSPVTTPARSSTPRSPASALPTAASPPARRRPRAHRLPRLQRRALRAARRTSRPLPRSPPAAPSSPRASRPCPRLRAVLCLGRIAHETLIRTLGHRLAAHPFAHGARHDLGRSPSSTATTARATTPTPAA